MPLPFALRMAWRDSRSSRGRLLLFSSSIACGVAALVALGSLSAALAGAVRLQTKALLGADLVVGARAAPPPAVQAYVDALGTERAHSVALSSMMVFPTAGGATRLVQVRAMEGAFPFYGDFLTEPRAAADRLRAAAAGGPAGDVVVLEEALMSQFHVAVGDRVKLGRSDFVVIGALKKLAGESLAVALLAPRALIPLAALAAAGLDEPGSLAFHRTALKLPPDRDPEALVGDLRTRFAAERLSFDTVEGRRRDLGRTLTNVDAFLGLVGFIALLLGAIGAASAVHVHLRQKLATIAVLRCLGASAGRTLAIYLAQGAALGVAGSALGAGLGVGVQLALPAVAGSWLPFPIAFEISWPSVGRGLAAGLALCGLFTLLPLLGVRRVSPLRALQPSGLAGAPSPSDPWTLAVAGAIVAAVAAFAVGQTHSLPLGLGFTGGIGLALGALAALAQGTAAGARRWAPRRLPYVVRQGLANLHRPNNRTVLLLLSLGLGTCLLLTLALTRAALVGEIASAGGAGLPNLLFFDIQPDQMAPLQRLLAAQGAPVMRAAPIVTMKILAVRGQPVEALLRPGAGGIPAWTLRREYRSTFRGETTGTERILAGRFVGRVGAGEEPVPISVEEGLARDMRLALGDEIDWDVQGVRLRTRVASLRAVEWRRLEPNFFVVFPEGVLEAAPRFYVAAVRAASPAASAALQRAVVQAEPNVTAIDLALVLETLDGIFAKVEFVLGFMALFTLATGLLVLAGAVLNGREQRRRENALLRALGATRRQLVQIQSVEHAILGALAGLVGGALALGASALLAHFVFHVPPALSAAAWLEAIAGVAAVTVLTGWIADRGLTRLSPLEVLRSE